MKRAAQPLPKFFSTAVAGLGVLTAALGALELAAPRKVAAVDDLDPGAQSRSLVRIAGAHKLAIGLGLIMAARKAPWLTAALAGGAFDAGSLAAKNARASAFARVAALAATQLGLLARVNQTGRR